MSRRFFDALTKFMGNLVYMSGMSQQTQREEWQGTAADDRTRVQESLAKVRAVWTQNPEDLATLERMVEQCLKHYEQGEFDPGDYLVRDIDEFQYHVRERAFRPKKETSVARQSLVKVVKASNDPQA
jgi:hypothetical protein